MSETMTDYSGFKPLDVDGPAMAFGGDFRVLAPMYKGYKDADVPGEFFLHDRTLWNVVVSQWFFGGLEKDDRFIPREGIDGEKALRHVGTVLRSWEPAHEVKEAICAYLLSLWFADFVPSKAHNEYFRNRVKALRATPAPTPGETDNE